MGLIIPKCPKHGVKHLFEQRGIGCTEFLCNRCAYRTGTLLTELFRKKERK